MRERKQKQVEHHAATMEGDYRIFHYLDDIDYHAPMHSHDFYEFYFLISGNLSYQIMDTFFALQPGDVLLFNRRQPHRPLFGNKRVPYERIVLRVNHDFLKNLSSGDSDLTGCFSRERYSLYRFSVEMQNNTRLLLSKLLAAQEQEGFGSELIYKAYLTELFVLVNRYCCENTQTFITDSAKKNQMIAIVNHYIDEHLESPITVEELAEHVYLSKYYFMRFFKAMTGTTVHQYITQKRLISVCNLMMEDTPITAACQQSGFGDYSCFFRAFKKQFGCPPRQYLHLARESDSFSS